MADADVDWKSALERWLKSNDRTSTREDRELRESFNQRFPKERLRELNLEEYCQGRGDTDNFCYWLERKTQRLGSMGGRINKFGVSWDAKLGNYRFIDFVRVGVGMNITALLATLLVAGLFW